jgi:hypothetical protein
MRRNITFAVCCALILTIAVSSGKEPGSYTTPAIWSADLAAFSYALRPSPRYIGGAPYAGRNSDVGVLFTSSGEVICYFLIRQAPGELVQRREPKVSDPFQVQIVAFDSGTGKPKYGKGLPGRFGDTPVQV